MSNKLIKDLSSGSIVDGNLGLIGDPSTGALTQTSYKAMKDYFVAGISGSGGFVTTSSFNTFSSSINTTVNNVFASESNYTSTSSFNSLSSSYHTDSASFNTRINSVTGSGGGGTISGSGASGSLTFWNGTTGITGSSSLLFDSTGKQLSLFNNGIANTATEGFSLRNQTPATSTVTQYSPSFIMEGNGWNTAGSGTPGSVKLRKTVCPLNGFNQPYYTILDEVSLSGSAYFPIITRYYDGSNQTLRISQAANQTGQSSRLEFADASGTVSAAITVFRSSGLCNFGAISSGGYKLTLWTNGFEAARFGNTGNFLLGTTTDGTGTFQNIGTSNLAGSVGIGVPPSTTSFLSIVGSTTAKSIMNLATGSAPSAPVDGDMWREDNTNTGLKIRIAGVTKTITVS